MDLGEPTSESSLGGFTDVMPLMSQCVAGTAPIGSDGETKVEA
jgi:hypothetical protein